MKPALKRSSSITSLASTKSISSHASLSDLLGSSITNLSSTLNAAVGATIGVTISTGNGSSKSKLQQQPVGISTELCMAEFKDFLCHTLAKEVMNSDDLDPLYESLEVSNMLQEELHDMEVGLLSLLKSNPTLPSKVVGQMHTFLGMVYMEMDNSTKAVESFMRAIWFIGRNPENQLAIAQANHRLGLAYGRKKEYQQAMNMLDRAIAGYEETSALFVIAKEDRHEVMEAQQLDLLAKSGRVSKAVVEDNAKNKRASRRNRVSGAKREEGMKRQNSFNRGLKSAMNALGGSGKAMGLPGFKRTNTAGELSLSRSSNELDVGGRLGVRRQASSAALL
jgi:Tetratricopeptide repeat